MPKPLADDGITDSSSWLFHSQVGIFNEFIIYWVRF